MCLCACSRRERSFACAAVRLHARSPVAIKWRVRWWLRLRRVRCTNVVYSSLSRLLSVVRETLRRHRWLATSRALRPKSARSLDSYVDRPTPTLDCKRKRARVRKLASAHPPTRPRALSRTSTHARLRPLSGGARRHSAVAISAPCMNAHLFVPEQQNSNHDKSTQRAQTHTHSHTRTRRRTRLVPWRFAAGGQPRNHKGGEPDHRRKVPQQRFCIRDWHPGVEQP